MEIRTATKEDLLRIMELGREFGHLMLYQKDVEIMEKYLPRILVAEETETVYFGGKPAELSNTVKRVIGYYHYIVSGDPGFEEMLRCYRQFPESLITEAVTFFTPTTEVKPQLCICMQGASHREVFREFILYLQVRYPEIWCYCSIKSQRVETYKALGFSFNPEEQFTFFNVSKGDKSTYQLGRWKR